jgi:hypothetical protein
LQSHPKRWPWHLRHCSISHPSTWNCPRSASRSWHGLNPQGHSLTCPVAPGNYCAQINFTSVSGGIRVNSTQSIGFTTGAGKAREWFRYSCTGGTCYIAPTNIVTYHARGTELQAQHSFGGGGMFLPCGNKFGVDWRKPATNAPGPGPVLIRVTC